MEEFQQREAAINVEVKLEAPTPPSPPSSQVVVTIKEVEEEGFSYRNKSTQVEQQLGSTVVMPTPESTCSPVKKLPPKPPRSDSVLRRRLLSKPKSRNFEEVRPSPTEGKVEEQEEEEDEEDEVYRREHLRRKKKNGGRWRRRWTFRMVVEWPILVVASACLVGSLTAERLEGVQFWGLEIWKWCVMVVVVFSGRLLAHWVVLLVVFLVERNFLFKKKVLYFVYGLKNSFQVCIWSGLVLCSWLLLFNRGVQVLRFTTQALNYVSRALASLWIGSMIWLIKTLLVKLLASSFHVDKFFDRIQVSVFHQYILRTLSGPPTMELAKVGVSQISGQLSVTTPTKGEGGKEVGVINIANLHKMKQEKVSAWTMKGLINAIRKSSFLTISSVIDDSIEIEEGVSAKDGEITSEWKAKEVGHKIFKNVAKPGYKHIEEEDLLRFLSKEQVEIILPMFEGAVDTGKIKKSAMKNWVVNAYLERKHLAHSLTDTKTAVRQLHRLVSVIVIIVIIVVTLFLMGFAITQVLVLISSQLLLVAFMFGNTCKTVFEGIIFVFIMHPFDVGDRCVIDGVQMIVEEMNILTTVFLRFDNEKISYPNAVLATKPISNFYRSPDMNDSVEFSIDGFTPTERIETLKARIKLYLESKPQHWHPKHSLVVKEIVNMNKMNLALYVLHTMNFQDIVEKNSRRTELLLELKKMFEELMIRYNLLPQEVHLSCTTPVTPSLAAGHPKI